jgi:hypothetical protein
MNTKHANAINVHAPAEALVGVLSIIVPFTTPELTQLALKQAASFGKALKARIRLIDAHVVPFPCPLNEPSVNRGFLINRLHELAQHNDLPVQAELILTRDRTRALCNALQPGSVVLIGTRLTWFPSAERKLARFLTRAGHNVMLLAAR